MNVPSLSSNRPSEVRVPALRACLTIKNVLSQVIRRAIASDAIAHIREESDTMIYVYQCLGLSKHIFKVRYFYGRRSGSSLGVAMRSDKPY